MLWFLHVACAAGFIPEIYDGAAEGVMTENEYRVLWISLITLQSTIVWGDDKQPVATEVDCMHNLARKHCFIANVVTGMVARGALMASEAKRSVFNGVLGCFCVRGR